MNTYQETPVYETSATGKSKGDLQISKGHVLIGLGIFFLLLQVIPGHLFLPLALIAAGTHYLRQSSHKTEGINRGHVLVGLGGFFLLGQILPGSLVIPALLIAAGIYFLQKNN